MREVECPGGVGEGFGRGGGRPVGGGENPSDIAEEVGAVGISGKESAEAFKGVGAVVGHPLGDGMGEGVGGVGGGGGDAETANVFVEGVEGGDPVFRERGEGEGIAGAARAQGEMGHVPSPGGEE